MSVSGADPLNVVGILTPGARIPSWRTNRILYRDGVPLAVREARQTHFLADIEAGEEWRARQALLRRVSAGAPPALRAASH
jgi:ATP-dependent Lhr-like helicase